MPPHKNVNTNTLCMYMSEVSKVTCVDTSVYAVTLT